MVKEKLRVAQVTQLEPESLAEGNQSWVPLGRALVLFIQVWFSHRIFRVWDRVKKLFIKSSQKGQLTSKNTEPCFWSV